MHPPSPPPLFGLPSDPFAANTHFFVTIRGTLTYPHIPTATCQANVDVGPTLLPPTVLLVKNFFIFFFLIVTLRLFNDEIMLVICSAKIQKYHTHTRHICDHFIKRFWQCLIDGASICHLFTRPLLSITLPSASAFRCLCTSHLVTSPSLSCTAPPASVFRCLCKHSSICRGIANIPPHPPPFDPQTCAEPLWPLGDRLGVRCDSSTPPTPETASAKPSAFATVPSGSVKFSFVLSVRAQIGKLHSHQSLTVTQLLV